jgi:chemotaxis protein MotA
VFAQLIAIPIADNLEMRAQNEYINQSLIIEAVACIHNRYNSRLVDELLSNYLPRNRRGMGLPGQQQGGDRVADPRQGDR